MLLSAAALRVLSASCASSCLLRSLGTFSGVACYVTILVLFLLVLDWTRFGSAVLISVFMVSDSLSSSGTPREEIPYLGRRKRPTLQSFHLTPSNSWPWNSTAAHLQLVPLFCEFHKHTSKAFCILETMPCIRGQNEQDAIPALEELGRAIRMHARMGCLPEDLRGSSGDRESWPKGHNC